MTSPGRRVQIALLLLALPVLYAVATAALFRYHSVALQVAPGGTRVATVRKTEYSRRSNYTVEVWDTESGERVLRVFGPNVSRFVAFSNDGSQFASLGVDGTIQLFDSRSGELRRIFTGTGIRTALVTTVFKFSDDGKTILYAQPDFAESPPGDYLHVFDLDSGQTVEERKRLLAASFNSSTRVVYADPQNWFLLTFTDKAPNQATVERIGIEPDSPTATVAFNSRNFSGALSPSGGMLATAPFVTSGVAIYSVATGKVLQQFQTPAPPVEFSPDGRLLACCDWNTTYIIDVTTGQNVAHLHPGGWLARGGFFGKPNHCFTREDGNLVERGFDGSRRIAFYSPYRRWPLRQSLSAAAFGAWLLAWLAVSIFYRRGSDALVNVVVIHAAVLFPATLRLVSESRAESSSLEAGVVQAAVGSLATLGVFWLILGHGRWPARIVLFLTGLAAFSIGMTLIWNSLHSHPFLVVEALKAIRQDFIIATAGGLAIALLFTGFLARFGSVRPLAAAPTGPQQKRLQSKGFTIPDMLRWAAGVALVCVVGRWIGAVSVNSDHVLTLLRVGGIEGFVAVAALWGAMGRSRVWLRLPLAVLLIAGAVLLADRLPNPRALPPAAIVLTVRTAVLMLTLGVLRALARPAPAAGEPREETRFAPAV